MSHRKKGVQWLFGIGLVCAGFAVAEPAAMPKSTENQVKVGVEAGFREDKLRLITEMQSVIVANAPDGSDRDNLEYCFKQLRYFTLKASVCSFFNDIYCRASYLHGFPMGKGKVAKTGTSDNSPHDLGLSHRLKHGALEELYFTVGYRFLVDSNWSTIPCFGVWGEKHNFKKYRTELPTGELQWSQDELPKPWKKSFFLGWHNIWNLSADWSLALDLEYHFVRGKTSLAFPVNSANQVDSRFYINEGRKKSGQQKPRIRMTGCYCVDEAWNFTVGMEYSRTCKSKSKEPLDISFNDAGVRYQSQMKQKERFGTWSIVLGSNYRF